MKYFLKICWFIALFICSILFFGNRMTERLSDEYIELTDFGESVLPVMSLSSDGVTANTLYGYTSELDPLSVRDNFITVKEDKAIDLIFTERGTDIRRLFYNIYDTSNGELISEGTINAFDYTETGKNTRIRLEREITKAQEYAVEVIAVTSESRRIFYYFRFKEYDEAYLNKKVNYILDFSESCRTKNLDFVIPYLESTYRDEGTTYSHTDIYDSYYMVCWGNLQPKLLTDVTVTITDIYKYIMVARLTYTVSLETDSGTEIYMVTEKYRVNIGENYIFLLNFERDLEAVFDVSLTSVSLDQLKLGITDETAQEFFYTSDNSMMAFVRNDVLYFYNLPENKIFNVYSLTLGWDYPSQVCDDHDLKILRMNENGDLVFMVAGYMNCGEYEGKTGILIYEYYRSENRIKELMFMPIAESYQHIKAELSGFTYMNSSDVFFFRAYDTLYSYNLSTYELKTLSDAPLTDTIVFKRKLGFICWQEKNSLSELKLYYLESGNLKTIRSDEFSLIILFGSIGDNMICGYGQLSDSSVYSDGTTYYPVSHVRIINQDETVLMNYNTTGYYVTAVSATETSIRLTRVFRPSASEKEYEVAEDDYILIHPEKKSEPFSVTSRITKLMMDEYYISLPYGYYLKEIPGTDTAKVTIINQNTTVRIQPLDTKSNQYSVFSFGELLCFKESLHDAIILADTIETVGVVVDASGSPVWARGIQNNSANVSSKTIEKAKELYSKGLKDTLVLNGCSLSEITYYVYRDVPVYAYAKNRTLLLTGYSLNTITFIDLSTGEAIEDSFDLISEELRYNGNVFRVVW